MQDPPSPCVRNCCLDQIDVCIGCGRHIDEILIWAESDASTRLAILEQAQARQRGRQSASDRAYKTPDDSDP